MKIFDHLVTQERRLKGARSVKSWSLISKRAARSLLLLPLVNFHLNIQKINKMPLSGFWNFFIWTFHFYFVKVFVRKNRADLPRWSAVFRLILSNIDRRSEIVNQVITICFILSLLTKTFWAGIFANKLRESVCGIWSAQEPPVTFSKLMISIRNFAWS